MNRMTTRALGLVAGVALSVSIAPSAAHAEDPPADPCATQQTQVDRAEAALERVQAVFARQKSHVREARADVRKADNRSERRAARADLARATARKAEVAERQRAQQMRLAKATERLEDCRAGGTGGDAGTAA